MKSSHYLRRFETARKLVSLVCACTDESAFSRKREFRRVGNVSKWGFDAWIDFPTARASGWWEKGERSMRASTLEVFIHSFIFNSVCNFCNMIIFIKSSLIPWENIIFDVPTLEASRRGLININLSLAPSPRGIRSVENLI